MIDKSARQYYANGQLVKPTRHGLRPGYRGDDAYGGGRSSGPAGGASSGGNYGGNTGGNQGGGNQGGGGGDGGAAARQAAAQRAMQQQIAQAEAQQAAQRAEADRQQRVAQQAAAEKAAAQKTATAGLRGDDPDLDKKAWDKIYQKQNEYLKTVDANTVSQLELDKIANDTLHQMYLGTGKPATQDYQNIFQTGAIHQTPGRNPITTGEGLGTINPFEQSGARTAIPTTPSYQNIFQTGAVSQTPGPGPVNPFEQTGNLPGGAYQPKTAPVTTGEGPGYQNIFDTGAVSQTPGRTPVINPFEETGNLPGGAYKPPAQIKNPFEQPGARTAVPKAPVINPFEQPGARTAIPTTPMRTRIQDERAEDIRKRALGNIALQTDKSLTDVFDAPKQGIMSSLVDKGKGIAGKMAKQFALQKLGLGFLNLPLGIASLFGFDPVGSLMAKLPKGTGTKTAFQPSEGGGEGQAQGQAQAPTNVIQAGIEKFQPTDQQTAQMTELMRKRMILQGKADQGELNEKGMNTLAQMNQMISQYQANPGSIYG